MPATTFASPLRVTLAVRANIRRAPSVSATVVRSAARGSLFVAIGAVTGDEVKGNDRWYVDAGGDHVWAGATDRTEPPGLGTAPADPVDPPPSADPDRESGGLAIDRSAALSAKDFNAAITPKNLIVLHFTAGQSAKSALDTWRADPKRIGTAYVVDLDGTIYEAFDPRCWASHLGIKGVFTHDRRSIGIEIANVGPLKRAANGKALNWWPNNFKTSFCSIDDEARFVRAKYRGIDFFAAFPDVQTRAVRRLVHHVAERFSIPKRLAAAARRGECDVPHFQGFSGIATHANFRKDKWDIGPAYDWDSLGI